ncbi:MAG: hypothetical protein A2Y50_07860 [Pseudomonadales bacterium RIFCSPLOWO2_12_59_9]|nr:MAG: hypothetical protein A2Y50_07860 [Pseudomonadales bacterium RIFCSPLOWO2_12_59_9]
MQSKIRATLAALALGLFSSQSPAAIDISLQHLQQSEVALFRAGTDLFMHRGEGRTQEQASQVDSDLKALNQHLSDLQQLPLSPLAQQAMTATQPLLANFDSRVRQTLAYAPSEADLPWEANFEYSKAQYALWMALQDVGSALEQTHGSNLNAADKLLLKLPGEVQSLATRYVARAYIGDIETPAEQQQLYIAQDIDLLAKSVNTDLLALQSLLTDADDQAKLKQIQVRWQFIYGRLLDYTNNLTPLMIERHAADVATRLLTLE